jgi:hypothetical protein
MKSRRAKPKLPQGRKGASRSSEDRNEATAEEFEREGMGVAPKE